MLQRLFNVIRRPKRAFVATLMQQFMVGVTERNCELVGDFEGQGARLGETQVVRLRRLAAADEARLRGDKGEVGAIADTFLFGEEKGAIGGFRV